MILVFFFFLFLSCVTLYTEECLLITFQHIVLLGYCALNPLPMSKMLTTRVNQYIRGKYICCSIYMRVGGWGVGGGGVCHFGYSKYLKIDVVIKLLYYVFSREMLNLKVW